VIRRISLDENNFGVFAQTRHAAHRFFDVPRFVARGDNDRNGFLAVRLLRGSRNLKHRKRKLRKKRSEKAIYDFFKPETRKRHEQAALLLNHVPTGEREQVAHVRCA